MSPPSHAFRTDPKESPAGIFVSWKSTRQVLSYKIPKPHIFNPQTKMFAIFFEMHFTCLNDSFSTLLCNPSFETLYHTFYMKKDPALERSPPPYCSLQVSPNLHPTMNNLKPGDAINELTSKVLTVPSLFRFVKLFFVSSCSIGF